MSNKESKIAKNFLSDPWIRYSIVFVVIYASLAYLRLNYSEIIKSPLISELKIEQTYSEFITNDDIELNRNFVEWFGVFYGFLLPLILVKAWEQFEILEKDFDKEADALKVFVEDIMLLPPPLKDKKIKIIMIAKSYVEHVKVKYIKEVSNDDNAKKQGNEILDKLRSEMAFFFIKDTSITLSPLISQLLSQLNVIIDVRGDRISNSKQRLFSGLKAVALLTSYTWLIPFYFLDYTLGLYGDGLIFTLSVLVVFVLHTIEDLDEPFYKKWKLNIDYWIDLEKEFNSNVENLM